MKAVFDFFILYVLFASYYFCCTVAHPFSLKDRRALSCKIQVAGGDIKSVAIDPSSTVADAIRSLLEIVGVASVNPKEFLIYENVAGLGIFCQDPCYISNNAFRTTS